MKKLIRKIFEKNNFDLIKEIDNIDFYNNQDYTNFYLVNYIDLTNTSKEEHIEELNYLENFYIGREKKESLKKLLYDSIEEDDDKKALDKNLSAVYIIEVDDSKKFYDDRNLIYDIEESPYFFKRYILAYTQIQANDLVDKMNKNGISFDKISDEDLSKLVDDFDEYKKLMKNEGEGYYELLVRLFCKLPFLNFTTNNKISIDSLEKNIEGSIEVNENLSVIYNCLMGKPDKLEKNESKEVKKEDTKSGEDENENTKSDEEKLIERLLMHIDGPKDSVIDEKMREYLGEQV